MPAETQRLDPSDRPADRQSGLSADTVHAVNRVAAPGPSTDGRAPSLTPAQRPTAAESLTEPPTTVLPPAGPPTVLPSDDDPTRVRPSDDTTTITGPDEEEPSDDAAPSDEATPSEVATVADQATASDDRDAAAPTQPDRTVWRCAKSTIVLVIVLMAVVGVAVPAAAAISLLLGVTAFGDQQLLVSSILGGLALLTLFFGWRLALHPRLVVDGDQLVVRNPFRTHRLDFSDITLIRPGGDGLVIGTPDTEVEAWCVQKSNGAMRNDRRTRADEVSDQLWSIRDRYHQPDEELPADLRWAHPGDAELLTELERSASLHRLGHIFPADRYPFPVDDVRDRWQEVLFDRTKQTMIAEVDGEPVGYACVGIQTLHHLGVAADYRGQGIGTVLLEAAEDELFADPGTAEAELWVLEDNEVARAFYRSRGWRDGGEERDAEFPPYPLEIRMVRDNPHPARHGR